MNIRIFVYALIAGFCFQAAAMDQELMKFIQQGSPAQIRDFAQEQFPTDTSFIMKSLRTATFAAVAAFLIQDKFATVSGKIVAGALGILLAAEGIAFVGGLAEFFSQKAQQEKAIRYFMNIRKGMALREQALDSDDSEEAGETK